MTRTTSNKINICQHGTRSGVRSWSSGAEVSVMVLGKNENENATQS